MKQFFVYAVLLATALTPVCAFLGDSDDRIENIYDKLVERHLLDDGTVSMLYRKDRYLYYIIFEKRVSVLERYCRVDGKDLSSKEIARFLKANTGERKMSWSRAPIGAGNDSSTFVRSDHKAEASVKRLNDRATLEVRVRK